MGKFKRLLRKRLRECSAALSRARRQWRRVPPRYAALGSVSIALLFASVLWLQGRSGTIPEVLGVTVAASNPETEKDPLNAPAWSFFHSAWADSSWLFPAPGIGATSLADTESLVHDLVEDPESKIETEFKVPETLKSRVVFWMEIYSRYTSRMRIVHDRTNPEIIYGIFDFRPIYRVLGHTVAAEVKINQLERKALKELKGRLQEAAGITSTKDLSLTERDQLQKFLSRAGASSRKEAVELLGRIRTQSGQADMFVAALFRSKQLLPHIESVFKRHGLPVGLARIPFVESSFNPRALSKGGAMGIWQFMPETARQMIHREDEKRWSDPLKQTQSAARLLKMYRTILPDWGSTVTSYNSGVGRVRRLMQKYRIRTVADLLAVEDEDGLGFAGKNFYSEFLAANLVEAYKDKLFGGAIDTEDFSLVFKGDDPLPKEYCDI